MPCASVSGWVFVRDLSYENEFDFHENELVGKTHFHMDGFARGLVLTPRLKATGRWFITSLRELRHFCDKMLKLHVVRSLSSWVKLFKALK